MGMAFDPEKALPRDVIDKILSESLDPESQDAEDAVITEEDIERVKKALEEIPELKDLGLIEVAGEAINEQEQ